MADPTRFEGGSTSNIASNSTFYQLGIGVDPTAWIAFDEDFLYYAAGDWTITNTGVTPTNALTDVQGGCLLTTITAADDDASFLQKTGEAFKFVSGKKTFFECRFKVSDATQSDIVFGLSITDTTPLAVTDGVYFLKSDGAATVDFKSLMNSAGLTVSAIATLANDTFVKLGFYYDGASNVALYVNNVKVSDNTVTIGTTLCNDEELRVTFGLQNGEAVAKNMTTDYIKVYQER